MKTLIPLILFLGIVQSAFGVGNRVIKDLEELKALGFEFVLRSDNSDEVASLIVTSPKQFDGGEDVGIKPFGSVSYMQTKEPTADGPALIGARASEFPLYTNVSKNGGHECRFTVLPIHLKNGYLEVTYMRGTSGDWPMLIHIPIAHLIEQIKKQNKLDIATPRKPSD
jgi:hypothetical protein